MPFRSTLEEFQSQTKEEGCRVYDKCKCCYAIHITDRSGSNLKIIIIKMERERNLHLVEVTTLKIKPPLSL